MGEIQKEKKWALLGSLASAYETGKDASYLEEYGSKVKKVQLSNVKQQAKDLIDKDQLTWVIVGDVSKIKNKLESLKLGDITYLNNLSSEII